MSNTKHPTLMPTSRSCGSPHYQKRGSGGRAIDVQPLYLE